MAAHAEPRAVVYVTDDFFPSDDASPSATADAASSSSSPSTAQHPPRLSEGEWKGTHVLSLFRRLGEGAEALEDYVLSDAAARDAQRFRWLRVPSITQRRQSQRLRQCMLEHTPLPPLATQELSASATHSGDVEVMSQVDCTSQPSPDTSNDTCNSTSLDVVDPVSASLLHLSREDEIAVNSEWVSGAVRVASARQRRSFADYAVLARGFTNSTFSAECWELLRSLPEFPLEKESRMVYELTAAVTFVSRHFLNWIHAASIGMVSGFATHVTGAVDEAPLDNAVRALSKPPASATVNTTARGMVSAAALSATGAALQLVDLLLRLLQWCLSLLGAFSRVSWDALHLFLPRTSSAPSILPARDSMMGALVHNAQWRVQVEVILFLAAALLVVAWVVVVLRYRKYTRVVELWEAVESRHNAAEARTWVRQMERRAFQPSAMGDDDHFGAMRESYTFPPRRPVQRQQQRRASSSEKEETASSPLLEHSRRSGGVAVDEPATEVKTAVKDTSPSSRASVNLETINSKSKEHSTSRTQQYAASSAESPSTAEERVGAFLVECPTPPSVVPRLRHDVPLSGGQDEGVQAEYAEHPLSMALPLTVTRHTSSEEESDTSSLPQRASTDAFEEKGSSNTRVFLSGRRSRGKSRTP